MKTLFRAGIFVALYLLLSACGGASQVTPVSVASPATLIPTSIPNRSATATIEPAITSTRGLLTRPTLIPTIDPTSVPKLLREALSLQTLEGMNGYKIRKITGWQYGFQELPCCGYQWLDSNHLLLYPKTGEGMRPHQDGQRKEDLSSQPVIMNLETGASWLPWSNISTSIYIARELGIVFQQEAYSSATGPIMDAVFTYTFDGKEITYYWGRILGVSPSGEKILVDDDTIIDLRNDKITDLTWHMDYDLEREPKLYWSSDETRIYRCCFYFADLKTGESYNFEWGDLRGTDGKPVSSPMSGHSYGQWVRNDTYFLIEWNYFYDSSAHDIPMFSPSEKTYYDLVEKAGIPSDLFDLPTNSVYMVSPDEMYVWITGFSHVDGTYHSFLVNLTTFESTPYDSAVYKFTWSADSQFGWIDEYDTADAYVLSVDSKELLPFPVNPRQENEALWHPTENVLAYTSKNDHTLALLNAKDMTVEEQELPVSVTDFDWSPNGDRIRFTGTDGGLWQVDYPMFQHFEQITGPMPDINEMFWSPDGNSIAFISGSDIYIVDTIK
ncbi:MAG: hypothetical protein JW730_17235 [Anaerolineales bacterium]|nr:hypothetical protein [Anaerolineales bacterium]